MNSTPNKTYLRFACGARLPGTGYLHEPWTPHVRAMYKEDRRRLPKRFPLIVWRTGGDTDRPVLDGAKAPCMFGCPCAGRANRKQEKCFLEDGSDRMGWIVTCCPEEIDEGQSDAQALAGEGHTP